MSADIWFLILAIAVPAVCYTIYMIVDRICHYKEVQAQYGRNKKEE